MQDDMIFLKRLWDAGLHQNVPKDTYDLQAYYDAGVVSKDDLVDGAYYQGHCRNADVALWDAKGNCFWYMRYKFGSTYKEKINHMADDNGFDLFVPFQKLDDVDDGDKVIL